MLIGIIGKARAGKGTLAELIMHYYEDMTEYAFAYPVKQCVNALFDWNEEHSDGDLKEKVLEYPIYSKVFIDKIKEFALDQHGMSAVDIAIAFLDTLNYDENIVRISPRIAYQCFGTDICRNLVRDDILLTLAPTDDVILSDVRFTNEVLFIDHHDGLIIQVLRDTAAYQVNQHSSESLEFNPDMVDRCIVLENNTTLYDLECLFREQMGIDYAAGFLFKKD